MIVAILSIILLAALLAYREYLHTRERAELLDRIQAPEVVISRRLEPTEAEDLVPIPTDMGPWSLPPTKEQDE